MHAIVFLKIEYQYAEVLLFYFHFQQQNVHHFKLTERTIRTPSTLEETDTREHWHATEKLPHVPARNDYLALTNPYPCVKSDLTNIR